MQVDRQSATLIPLAGEERIEINAVPIAQDSKVPCS